MIKNEVWVRDESYQQIQKSHNEALKKTEDSKRETYGLQGTDTCSHEGREKNIYIIKA